jgi:molybdopterin-guanine dinucleotide biosynthesis protein A
MGVEVTGFAVAGGRSQRMGSDKALLPWAGTTLLEHTLARLREVCAEVCILSGAQIRYSSYGAPVHPDRVPEAGPLGGIHAGLLNLGVPVGLFLGVDMPLVPSPLLRALVGAAGGFDAVVPVVGGRPEPLCAVYRGNCLAPVQRRLEAGERKMTSFWADVRVRTMAEDELAIFGDPVVMFRNLNTTEDYLRLRG